VDREIDVDVVFAVNDVMAVGATAALRDQGYRVPQDMAVAGFDTLLDLALKIREPRPIEPMALGFSAATAALSGFVFVGLLLPFRESRNPLVAATWLSARNSLISSVAYASVTLVARLATSRTVEYGLDILAAGLSFQAAWIIFRDALRQRRTT
jgi:Co/Zn/Cd efflux system component